MSWNEEKVEKLKLEMHLQVKILIIVWKKTLPNKKKAEKASFNP